MEINLEQNQQAAPQSLPNLPFNDLVKQPAPILGNNLRSRSLKKRYHNPGYF